MAETVATMASLRTLSLCVGGDLTPRALSAIASFPYLEDLRIQLDGMDADALAEALHPCSSSAAQIFPSLQILRVRSAPSVVEVLFDRLPTSNTLHTLHLESDFKPRPVDDWIPAFTLLASKTHATLTSLSIESLSSFCEVPDHAFPPKLHFTLDTLRPLARLARLERFSIDPSVPADLSDADLAALARWFPAIASLGLWTHPVDAFDAPAYFSLQPRATPASLTAFATHCPRLRKLALPMDVCTLPHAAHPPQVVYMQTALESLTIGCARQPVPPSEGEGDMGKPVDPASLAECIYLAFPALKTLEFDSGAGDEAEWKDVLQSYFDLQRAGACACTQSPQSP